MKTRTNPKRTRSPWRQQMHSFYKRKDKIQYPQIPGPEAAR